MEITALPLAGLVLVTPRVWRDDRGFLVETYRADQYRAAGIAVDFVQDNHSRSTRGTLRGMHFQSTPGQAKLVRCARGTIWDVAVDIRRDSPTFGKWHGEILDDDRCAQMFIPIGFAHGFIVLSDVADVAYRISSVYDGKTETGFAYDDPDVGIAWPDAGGERVVSARDRTAKPLREVIP